MWAPPRAHIYAFDPTSQARTTVVQPSKHNLSHHPIGEIPYYSRYEVLWKHHLLLPSNKCTLWLDQLKYRIQDRMLIPHFQIRKLLSMYTSKGLSSMEFLDLMSLLEQHFPCNCSIVKASAVHYDLIKDIHTCDKRWSELIRSISSASAACGTLHPSSRSSQLISSMQSKDISNDPDTMNACS